jgi:hypothetical protein
VAAAFSIFPAGVRARLLEVRELIFETAADIKGVGPLTETLKWGEPAYLTQATGSGSTIRLGWFGLRSAIARCSSTAARRSWTISVSGFPASSLMRRTGPLFSTQANRCPRLRSLRVSEWRSHITGAAKAPAVHD